MKNDLDYLSAELEISETDVSKTIKFEKDVNDD